MDNYRELTDDEIMTLEYNGCTAESWSSVHVDEDFSPEHIKDVRFYGTVRLGVFERYLEIADGFKRQPGLRNVTLNNATIGDNCLIENVWNYIRNYEIGDECYISNVSTIETTSGANFGEGVTIPVLNEGGSGNIVLYRGLNSNMAALLLTRQDDKELLRAVRDMARADMEMRLKSHGTIGNRVRIVNTTEITDTNIDDNCEVNGARRIDNCTIAAEHEDSVYIGTGVICKSSIIYGGSEVLDNANLSSCYVGESCRITDGFTASNSLFFANSYMANGEACAAFCGPFSASHHKSSLLIGCMVSFYNAGSATNFSNHAYKMGPIHYGTLERGSKTASGSHIVLPATIGAFSVCLGKIANHPDTHSLPFSYVIGEGRDTYIVPGKNIATVGLYRDTHKWRRRDTRLNAAKKSIINYEWLNPVTVREIANGRKLLADLRQNAGEDTPTYTLNGNKISANSLKRGLRLYTTAMELFIGQTLANHSPGDPCNTHGTGEWRDLGGLLLPAESEEMLVEKIKCGVVDSTKALDDMLNAYNERYGDYLWAFTVNLMKEYLGKDELREEDFQTMRERGNAAREAWLAEIRDDAEREYSLGDVDKSTLDDMLKQLS